MLEFVPQPIRRIAIPTKLATIVELHSPLGAQKAYIIELLMQARGVKDAPDRGSLSHLFREV